METVATRSLGRYPNPLLPRPTSPPVPRRFVAKGSAFSRFRRRGLRWSTKSLICASSSSSSSNSLCYGGWEDLEPLEGSSSPDGLGPIRHFLVSLGVGDKKHAFLFCLGFLSAFAVSRVRFSAMAMFPVSVLVFVAGLYMGVAQGGGGSDGLFELVGRKQGIGKNESLVEFLNDLDTKMLELKGVLERAVVSNHMEIGEVKTYLGIVESVRLAAIPAKKSVGDFVNDVLSIGAVGLEVEGERKSSQRSPSRKMKGMDVASFDLVQFIGGLFQENLVAPKASKAKNVMKREPPEQSSSPEKDNQNVLSVEQLAVQLKGDVHNSVAINQMVSTTPEFSEAMPDSSPNSLQPSERLVENRQDQVKHVDMDGKSEVSTSSPTSMINRKQNDNYGNSMFSHSKEHADLNSVLHFTSKQQRSRRMALERKHHKNSFGSFQNNLNDFAETEVDNRAREIEMPSSYESALHAQSTVELYSRSYKYTGGRESGNLMAEQGNYINGYREGKAADKLAVSGNQQSNPNGEADKMPSSSSSPTVSADEEFNQKLKEATELLKRAKEYLKTEAYDETTETILYECGKLLSTAVALKPMSLLAIGKLGNTFLLHGELKLKISRDLRALLSESDSLIAVNGHGVQSKSLKLNKQSLSKEEVASVLIDECEKCEELLVEAGKLYRIALSIDKSDVRALYNWGLALTFRAQLIGDIGPEAAFDADKVYLAAIDKFAALTSKSNTCAPDALFRWGVALQQRSQLRPSDSREKMRLLRQAKSLYEDVLRVDSDNPLVREALFSCISELNYYRQLS